MKFQVFGSQTPRTADTKEFKKSWEFEIEAKDIERAKRQVIRQATKLGFIDELDKEAIKAGWNNFVCNGKRFQFRAFYYSVAGIYIAPIETPEPVEVKPTPRVHQRSFIDANGNETIINYVYDKKGNIKEVA